MNKIFLLLLLVNCVLGNDKIGVGTNQDASLLREDDILKDEDLAPLFIERPKEGKTIEVVRKLIDDGHIDEIVKNGYLQILSRLLDSENSTIIYQAALSVTFIATDSDSHFEAVTKAGVVPKFLPLLLTENENLVTSISMFLQKLIFEFHHLRRYYDEMEVVINLRKLINSNPPCETVNNAVYILISLCDIKNIPLKTETVKEIVPLLIQLLWLKNPDIVEKAAMTLPVLAMEEQKYKSVFSNPMIIRDLINLLSHENKDVQKMALMILASTAKGNEKEMFKNGITAKLPKFLKHHDSEFVMHVLRLLHRLTDTVNPTKNEIAQIFNPKLIALVVDQLFQKPSLEIEIIVLLSSFSLNGNETHISAMVDKGAVKGLCKTLKSAKSDSDKLIYTILVNFYGMLDGSDDKECQIFKELEECGGMSRIKKLKFHKKSDVNSLASGILDSYAQSSQKGSCSKKNEL